MIKFYIQLLPSQLHTLHTCTPAHLLLPSEVRNLREKTMGMTGYRKEPGVPHTLVVVMIHLFKNICL